MNSGRFSAFAGCIFLIFLSILLSGFAIAAAGGGAHDGFALKGALIFYSSANQQLTLLDMESRKVRPLGFKGRHPALSPDRRTVAYIDEREVLHVGPVSAAEHLAFPKKAGEDAFAFEYSSPTFISNSLIAYVKETRKGKLICYSPIDRVEEKVWQGLDIPNHVDILAVPGSNEKNLSFVLLSNQRKKSGLFLLSAGGGSRAILPAQDETITLRYPSISPDGKRIAFILDRGKGGIWIVNVDGTGLREIDRDSSWPAWSPDGKFLACLRTSAATRGLDVVDARNGKVVGNTGGAFLEGIHVLNLETGIYAPMLDGEGKILNTRGDNFAWQ